MNYSNTINYLYGLQKHGIKLGLDNIRRLLSFLGNPHDSFPSVHVAGTNGKGSTSAMIASILQAAGLKTGLFTSPHLISFTERIRVDSEEITEYEVVRLADEIRNRIQTWAFSIQHSATENSGFNPTFFEVVTAMGFLYFKRRDVDWAVVETGMGGRLDATNVLTPEVSVITNIGYDHKEFLGDTITAIAGEKAGIIKHRIPVVSALQDAEAMGVIEKTVKERFSDLYAFGEDFSFEVKAEGTDGSIFDYYGDKKLRDIKINLPGRHQVSNASVAIKAIEAILRRFPHYTTRITPDTVRYGLENVRWKGRLEFISDNPAILIDGAHNPSAAEVLAGALKEIFLKRYSRLILVIGAMSDKDIRGILRPLLPLASEVIFTAPSYERAAPPQKLAEIASTMGYSNVYIAQTVKEAIEMAIASSLESERAAKQFSGLPLILVTGSFYTIGEAKEALGASGILSRLGETR